MQTEQIEIYVNKGLFKNLKTPKGKVKVTKDVPDKEPVAEGKPVAIQKPVYKPTMIANFPLMRKPQKPKPKPEEIL